MLVCVVRCALFVVGCRLFGWSLLFVVVVWCVFVVCCVLCVACCFVVCCVSFAVCCVLCVVC